MKKKSLDEMSTEELLEELRKSQGPGDALIEIRPRGITITRGKSEEKKKPKAPLVGANGNVFNLIGIASHVLKSEGLHEEVKQMTDECFNAGSYNQALQIIMKYVDPI